MVEQPRLLPMSVPVPEIDPVAPEVWPRAQTAAREVVDPLAALPVESDDIASEVQRYRSGRRDSRPGLASNWAVIAST